ncbi:hypothetical protein [Achromobacter xylosoxidans]|uniref:Uncharacterized protein n=1 Tax=Achromobacter phage JWX TaxID=1589746 RepID=A0A0B5A6P2_9CAUD|nr:hypothetical protein [Achromobacter xylosoxidans]YP_009196225.1 hypothetical protein AVV28_gp40 [Achromobacter phage JWX]AJD82806.1 hypothetical protein JWX_00040 [Achromobacter phage JWX]WLW38459.1 hypothetical protein JWT_00035 [Achromobacter phage JWT]
MARKSNLQIFLDSTAIKAGRPLTTSEKARITRAWNAGDGKVLAEAASGLLAKVAKKSTGQRAAYDDLNKQAQAQTSEELVDSRVALYGTFCGRAELTVDLLERMQKHPKWVAIPPWGKWALTMLVEKIGRIIEGDPKYDDNWKDIGGYAELARRNAMGEKA